MENQLKGKSMNHNNGKDNKLKVNRLKKRKLDRGRFGIKGWTVSKD